MYKRYHVTTFGCQMNAHDSERIKGLLEELGLGEAPSAAEADVVVFNTCTIREKPDTKLAAYLGEAAARKREDPDRVIAVGGCYAEAQRERIFELYPDVDVALLRNDLEVKPSVGFGRDGVAKVMQVAPVMEASARLGIPGHIIPGLGAVLIAATLIYAFPRTSQTLEWDVPANLGAGERYVLYARDAEATTSVHFSMFVPN